jgi:succinate-semialdehyde dehydrogenase / glutarate-semialdehyde dehydrogenase
VSATLESRSPATGESLGTVVVTPAEAVPEAVARAAGPQPLWALVPAEARARYLRRTAQAILDELDPLADLLAREVGQPRTEALLAELLPAVAGLHALADEGPEALADRRLGRIPLLRAGRRNILVQAPAGVVAIRGGHASPWAEPVLEVGAALLAGNGVVLAPAAPLAGERIRAAFERARAPEGLIQVVHGEPAAEALGAHAARVVDAGRPQPKGTMLVLEGAPVERAVAGALWAAFAGAGRHPAGVGRVVAVPAVAEELLRGIETGARRLLVGDPRHPETEVGPLASAEDLARVEALVEEAVAGGATVVCGGAMRVAGLKGAFYAPAVLRGVPPEARILREPVPGPVLAVVEAGSEREAIALVGGRQEGESAAAAPPTRADVRARPPSSATVSVWTGDRGHGERVVRALGAELTWVNEHGIAAPAAPVRLAHHTEQRQLASQPTRLRSARWLPYDPALVQAATATARVLHGRERERLATLRDSAIPLLRTAVRLAREALRL